MTLRRRARYSWIAHASTNLAKSKRVCTRDPGGVSFQVKQASLTAAPWMPPAARHGVNPALDPLRFGEERACPATVRQSQPIDSSPFTHRRVVVTSGSF